MLKKYIYTDQITGMPACKEITLSRLHRIWRALQYNREITKAKIDQTINEAVATFPVDADGFIELPFKDGERYGLYRLHYLEEFNGWSHVYDWITDKRKLKIIKFTKDDAAYVLAMKLRHYEQSLHYQWEHNVFQHMFDIVKAQLRKQYHNVWISDVKIVEVVIDGCLYYVTGTGGYQYHRYEWIGAQKIEQLVLDGNYQR